MQLGTLSQEYFSAEEAVEHGKILAKKFGFVGVVTRPVNGDWVVTAEEKEQVALRTRKPKESTPPDPADLD